MYRPLAVLLPLLLLAACGGGGSAGNAGRTVPEAAGPASFDRPDGSFDRAGYRVAALRSCIEGMQAEGLVTPEIATRNCTCLVDRLIAANSDAVLRAAISDDALARRTFDAASRQCGLPVPTDADLEGTPVPPSEPPPPPDEPVPSNNDTMPPPVVQDGPPPRR